MTNSELKEVRAPGGSATGVETGSFAPPEISPDGRSKLIIASFNIRYAVGSFLITGSLLRRLNVKMPGRRPGLVARHIRTAARAFSDERLLPPPDILALQEADKETIRAGGHHVARELARELRTHYAHAATNIPRDEEPKSKQWYLDFEEHIPPTDEGDTGLAFLSRFPFADVSRMDLPWEQCAWRPRLALKATFTVAGKELRVFNSHIDPHASIDEQLRQHSTILAEAGQAEGPVVLLGDFNTLSKQSCVSMRRLLEEHDYQTPFGMSVATWRAGLVRLHTDWIFLRGARAARWGVARGLGVSDHWPVWVEIDLNAVEKPEA